MPISRPRTRRISFRPEIAHLQQIFHAWSTRSERASRIDAAQEHKTGVRAASLQAGAHATQMKQTRRMRLETALRRSALVRHFVRNASADTQAFGDSRSESKPAPVETRNGLHAAEDIHYFAC